MHVGEFALSPVIGDGWSGCQRSWGYGLYADSVRQYARNCRLASEVGCRSYDQKRIWQLTRWLGQKGLADVCFGSEAEVVTMSFIGQKRTLNGDSNGKFQGERIAIDSISAVRTLVHTFGPVWNACRDLWASNSRVHFSKDRSEHLGCTWSRSSFSLSVDCCDVDCTEVPFLQVQIVRPCHCYTTCFKLATLAHRCESLSKMWASRRRKILRQYSYNKMTPYGQKQTVNGNQFGNIAPRAGY